MVGPGPNLLPRPYRRNQGAVLLLTRSVIQSRLKKAVLVSCCARYWAGSKYLSAIEESKNCPVSNTRYQDQVNLKGGRICYERRDDPDDR